MVLSRLFFSKPCLLACLLRIANSLVAQRKCYGSQTKKAVIPEDTAPEGIWRWEVQLMDLLPADKVMTMMTKDGNCVVISGLQT